MNPSPAVLQYLKDRGYQPEGDGEWASNEAGDWFACYHADGAEVCLITAAAVAGKWLIEILIGGETFEIPDPTADENVMLAAIDLLRILPDPVAASWEHPGYIGLKVGHKHYHFGDANGHYGYDVSDDGDAFVTGSETLPADASPLDLARFIVRVAFGNL